MRHRFVATLIGFGLVVVACSGNGDVVDLDDAVGPESSTTSSPSTTSSSSTTTTEPPADDPPEDAEAAVTETWTTLLGAARSGAPNAEQVAVIESLAGPETVEQLLAPLFPEVPTREIEFFPALTAQDDGSYAIDDCLVMNRGISVGVSNWFIGAAEPSDDSPTGYVITEISVINLDPCVPRSIAEAAIDGYEAHWDALNVFYSPPDPTSPLIEETTTGGYRDFVLDLIDDLAGKGQVLRGRPETAPEFFEIRSASEVVIIDCQEVDPGYGVYIEATGERTDRIAPIGDGELDLRESTMLLEGGTWKMSDRQGNADVQCRTPPTPPTLQVTGG